MPTEEAAERLVGLQTIEEQLRPRRSHKAYTAKPGRGFVPARVPKAPTFEEHVQAYMTSKANDVRPSTRRRDQSAFENHIRGTALGKMTVTEIDRQALRDYWAGETTNLANLHSLLSGTFTWLEGEGLLYGPNPWKGARLRRPRSEPRDDVLTVEEIELIADAAERRSADGPRDRLMILLMAYGGLRAGEVGGIRKQDVTFDGDRVRLQIRGAVTHDGKGLGPTKSKGGRRPKVLNGTIPDELREYMAQVPPARDGRIFHGSDPDKMLYAVRVYQIVKLAAEAAGIEGVHPHKFRHTAASMVADDGWSMKAVQEFLGDSTPTMAMRYVHTFGHEQDAIADTMTRRREASGRKPVEAVDLVLAEK